MSILIAYSSKQSGTDPFVPDFTAWVSHSFTNGGDVTVLDLATQKVDNKAYEIVFLVDSLPEYAKQRVNINGSPWVCLIAWTFDCLRHLPKSSAFDLGVHHVVSNCAMFIKQLGLVIPSEFSWKPLPNFITGQSPTQFVVIDPMAEPEPVKLRNIVGTVLHNVLDRDFSLLRYTGDWFDKAGQKDRFKIFVHENETMRLPADLKPFLTPYKIEAIPSLYDSIQYYVPAPRIVDYRSGVVPPEILYALGAGAKVLMVKHPVMDALKLFDVETFGSLSTYRDELELVKVTEASPPAKVPFELSDFGVDKFISGLYNAYRRAKVSASA